MKKAKLTLTPNQFAVIYQFLVNTRLGNRNKFEDAISNLFIDMEHDGAEAYLNEYVSELPKIHVEFSEDEGMVFNITE
jgi:hypothetical protein